MNSNWFLRWIAALLIAASGANLLPAAENESAPLSTPDGATNFSLSVRPPAKRAAWQERLTLGPGDVLNLSLFDMPDTTWPEVVIRPDGRLTFLQARDIVATGLTIDELRAKMDQTLATFYRNPHTIITPAAFRSKKYFVLGAVVNRGVYNFERPLTVIEAIARAGGLETGLYEQRTVEMADLGHSFLVRHGQRVPVDFERLFQRGDLAQNVALEPDDYLYFASAIANQIYVLGEVMTPGVLAFSPKPTVLNVIAARGGFSDRAFKSRVLVVRGSLSHPQPIIVDSAAILAGKAPDFKLEPRDIVYVNQNPWTKVEDLLDTAVRAFLQGMTVEWTALNIGAPINKTLLHGL